MARLEQVLCLTQYRTGAPPLLRTEEEGVHKSYLLCVPNPDVSFVLGDYSLEVCVQLCCRRKPKNRYHGLRDKGLLTITEMVQKLEVQKLTSHKWHQCRESVVLSAFALLRRSTRLEVRRSWRHAPPSFLRSASDDGL